MSMRRVICICATALTVRLAAQVPDGQPPIAFEAASVKPNRSGDADTSLRPQPGGRFSATNAPVALFITYAYQLQPFQLQGGPGWIRSDRFDVTARLGGDSPVLSGDGQATPLMLAMRTLLGDRFALVVHWETQDLPIYALVPARSDRKLGPNIRPSTVDCVALSAARAAAAKEGRTLTPNASDQVVCGMRNSGGRFQFGGNPMSTFALGLSNQVGRVVVDRTGLSGNWDFEFTFTPERVRQASPGSPQTEIDPNGPSLFTALQEQLGLKLESTKGPVRVLVIDHVEQASPD